MPTQPDWVSDVVAGLPSLLTLTELIAVLRCSRRQAYRYLDRGELKAQKIAGNRIVVPRAELERYLRSLDLA